MNYNYVSDKSRKPFIASKLSKMPPFKICERGPVALIIEMGGSLWMSIKREGKQRIDLFPMKKITV